ncbi:hypothetical protein ACFXPI_01425 [Streptomyces sp. NPDC059104]|uniref:hypothetical protein n=1 Tax=Streptomyces sp. NPDC059104 TaxID=3346729 RepID=UPI0036ACDB86
MGLSRHRTLNGAATLGDRTSLGTNWETMRQLVGADSDNDGKGELSAVQAPATSTGTLYPYPGTGATAPGPRAQTGTNWCAPTARPGAHHGPRSQPADGQRRDEPKRAAGVGSNVPDHPCVDPAGFLRAT